MHLFIYQQVMFSNLHSEEGFVCFPPCNPNSRLVTYQQVVFKNLRIMNGNSKEGFGGAIEVSGPVDLSFIDCEFGGSISECGRVLDLVGYMSEE